MKRLDVTWILITRHDKDTVAMVSVKVYALLNVILKSIGYDESALVAAMPGAVAWLQILLKNILKFTRSILRLGSATNYYRCQLK
ncbi:MAG TPA: hypothetical protein DIW66_22575 [Serratia liquefaciens]|nr:hypothetical protein [Serratia liquefaciens]